MPRRFLKGSGRRFQRGAEIVEFLVTLPLMILVLYMLVELGVAYINQMVVTDAARAAAREAARGGTATEQQAAAEGALQSLLLWFGAGSQTKACGGKISCPTWPVAAGSPVTISYDFNYYLLNLVNIKLNNDMSATATFPDLQN